MRFTKNTDKWKYKSIKAKFTLNYTTLHCIQFHFITQNHEKNYETKSWKELWNKNDNLISEQVGFEFRYEERCRRFSVNIEG